MVAKMASIIDGKRPYCMNRLITSNEHIGNSYLFYSDHNMVFSLWLRPTTKLTRQKMQANRQRFRWPWQCSGTTQGASPQEAHPGLHSKPLDAAIGRVHAPYHPDRCHGRGI